MTKHVFVTGGVVSGLGKGITAASLGRLLKMRGYKVASQKLDPYMNVDPGTMSPYQHGEVFVTDDGAETDLDLGHYERFIDESLNKYSNLTSGKVYWNVLNRERKGEYLGQTVQVIPHITEEIKHFIYMGAESSDADVLITEIGGTTGDIESQPFLEAIRQISLEKGRENCCFIHVTLVPWLSGSNEHKSKPTQHSVKELQSQGIAPDIIVCRVDHPLEQSIMDKISLFCNVEKDCVIENDTMNCLYEAPLMLHKNGLDDVVCRKLGLENKTLDLSSWEAMVKKIGGLSKTTRIAIVGKYVALHDAYLSVREALLHGGYANDANVEIDWIDSEGITRENAAEKLKGLDGILVPGGFGDRGVEGMIAACEYARTNDIPYLGICLGMQVAAIEFARNVCGYEDANSGEFNPGGQHLIIDLMEEQMAVLRKGGTMRLGAYPCKIAQGTKLMQAYGENEISERHRHRFEFNNKYRDEMREAGLTISGTSPDDAVVEAVEVTENKFHVGVQFHPEFKSRPNKPHPLFAEFIKASLK
ncbi:MAG: CTP synthase [Lachnospiraceae bacterium]|nr:CTP synthase [Lachnospiraceae bacterium]MDD6191719.1 CTP synthase [Lachnospiraceae bacterium]MDY4794069.1 CTP synthase [Pararoseburia sp.]